jgi:hypothetical protein
MMNDALAAAIQELSLLFEVDGYRLQADRSGDEVTLRIVATEGACSDCLVPKAVMRQLVLDVFERHGTRLAEDQLALSYPTDKPRTPLT